MAWSPLMARSLMAAAAAAAFGIQDPALAGPGSPLGAQFQVNPETAAFQSYPDVARDADGDFVIVWPDRAPQSFSDQRILGQRFAADGSRVGDTFEVASRGLFPSIAMASDGDFTVAWQSDSRTTIFARRFHASGVPVADAVTVGTGTNASHPDVAMDDDGDFVVAWEQYDGVIVGSALGCYYGTLACVRAQGGSIRARRYTGQGTKAGAVQTVSTSSVVIDQEFVGSFSRHAGVAMARDNSFVVTWDRPGNSLLSGAWFRRYSPAGLGGTVTRVSSQADRRSSAGSTAPDVGMDAAGNFVIAFRRLLAFPELRGIFVRRYRANGAARGPEFRVDQVPTVAHDGNGPVIAVDDAGAFAVAWDTFDPFVHSVNPTVSARVFAADGTPLGNTFGVPSAPGPSYVPRIASDAGGNFVATWLYEEGPDGGDVAARLFEGP